MSEPSDVQDPEGARGFLRWFFSEPSALNRPISLVLSLTAIVMIVRMPTPPTSSEIPPSPPTARVRMLSILPSTSSIFSWVVMVKSSLPWRSISIFLILAETSSAELPSL